MLSVDKVFFICLQSLFADLHVHLNLLYYFSLLFFVKFAWGPHRILKTTLVKCLFNLSFFYLCFGELELLWELHSLGHREILVPLEFALEGLDLGGREGRPRPLLTVISPFPLLTWKVRTYTVKKNVSGFPGNNLIITGQGECGKWHPGWGRESR
jgi:hypothetical protein